MKTTPTDLNEETLHATKARYVMIGGFLGAGKTTAVGKLATRLAGQGIRVGLITNDQGRNLVDTAMLRSQGFDTEEIPGGCFCCRFPSLVEASQRLTEAMQPQVFVAEPVGSCTDLAATVTYPLRHLYGGDFTVAPVSVLLDPIRALRVFGLEEGDSFSEKVLYIYLKQIEEADLVVISKCDLLDEARLESLRQAIATKFPGKEILAVSARDGTNLDSWFDRITTTEQVARTAMQVDYQVYADGEALLGWLNCTAQLKAGQAFATDAFLKELAGAIQNHMQGVNAQVAHLKMTLSPDASQPVTIAGVNLVRNDFVPELSFHLAEPVTDGQLIINLRAEAAPDVLGTAVREGLAAAAKKFPTLHATLDHLEHFRPGKPTPTHRIENCPPDVTTIMQALPKWAVGEFFGTFLLVFFGCGSVCASVLTGAQVGVFQVAIVWGIGIATAIHLTGSLSGAHLNPAVTVSMAVWTDFPKRRVVPYVVTQMLGAFAAAAVLHLVFGDALRVYEQINGIVRGGPGSEASAMVFGEFFPSPGGKALTEAARARMSPSAAFGAEVIGTSILLLVIFCVTDERNKAHPRILTAATIGLTVTLLISLLGPLTMACFNPARDLGPRVFSSLSGWGRMPFEVNGQGWLTVYICAPLVGGVLGGFLYRFFFRNSYAGSKQSD